MLSRMAAMSARLVLGFTIANRVTISPSWVVGVTNAEPLASSSRLQRL